MTLLPTSSMKYLPPTFWKRGCLFSACQRRDSRSKVMTESNPDDMSPTGQLTQLTGGRFVTLMDFQDKIINVALRILKMSARVPKPPVLRPWNGVRIFRGVWSLPYGEKLEQMIHKKYCWRKNESWIMHKMVQFPKAFPFKLLPMEQTIGEGVL